MEHRKNPKLRLIVGLVALAIVLGVARIAYSTVLLKAGTGGESLGSSRGETSVDGHWNNPALSSVTIADSDGYPITMGALADGKVTVVNVWASWCQFCIDEMPDYQALFDKYGDSVQFVMLDSAENSQEVAAAHDYIEERGFTFPVFYDVDQELKTFFSVASYPTTIVIDANGEVLSNKPGRIVAASFDDALSSLVE